MFTLCIEWIYNAVPSCKTIRSLRTMLKIWVYFTIILLQQEIATSKVKRIILLHQSPDTDGLIRYYSTQPNMNLQLQGENEPEKKIIGDRYHQNHTKLNQNIQIYVEYV